MTKGCLPAAFCHSFSTFHAYDISRDAEEKADDGGDEGNVARHLMRQTQEEDACRKTDRPSVAHPKPLVFSVHYRLKWFSSGAKVGK